MTLGTDYNKAAILTAVTATGIIEILFTKDGELLQPENVKLVNDISTSFEKTFQAGTLDGQPCYIHSLTGLSKAQQQANSLLQELKSICDLEFNNDTLQDIYEGKGERTANTIESKVRLELKRAGISSDTIIKAAVAGDLEKYYSIFNHKTAIESEFLSFLFIDNGGVCIKEGTNDEVKEIYSTYITTEKGMKIYEAQKAAIQSVII